MAYQVLARKWRPRNFAALVGQEHVVRALTHALDEQRLHHAYLFTGTRGVGKTTVARILAKSLNCEQGVSANPCGVCSACTEIDAGRFVDLLEVDAATNTRVDEMRQLLENAVYAPTRGRYKVYVIDEVHMLSTSAFNAMLKTLEEPPEHVKFILATTDPQKIPVTVLSRCLQFNLKQMPVPLICSHLAKILEAESISCEADALPMIGHAAMGSMRDALSLLDQAIAHGAGTVVTDSVRAMLGAVSVDYLVGVLEAVRDGEGHRLVEIADRMAEQSLSFAGALRELALLLLDVQSCQLAGVIPARAGGESVVELAAQLSPEWVQLAYQIVVAGRAELAMAPDEYAGFLMTVLRLLAFAPDDRSASASKVVRTLPTAVRPAVVPVDQSVPEIIKSTLPTTDKPTPAGPLATSADWLPVLERLQLGGMARELAQHCEFRGIAEGVCLLRLDPDYRHLQMKSAEDKLEQTLRDYLACSLALRIEVAEVESATPAASLEQARTVRLGAAQAAIEQDPFVNEVIESMDAALDRASIKPV
jgi:DNA polymerase III subunit gamma/tau